MKKLPYRKMFGEWKVRNCPFHDDRRPSLAYNSMEYICFACGRRGWVKDLDEAVKNSQSQTKKDVWLYRPVFQTKSYLLTEEEAEAIYYKYFPSSLPIDNVAMEWAIQTELQLRNYCLTRFDIPARPFEQILVRRDPSPEDAQTEARLRAPRAEKVSCEENLPDRLEQDSQDHQFHLHGGTELRANHENKVYQP